ncbi:hypothetical protein [Xanthobacter autotrophicus]|uniref:hypothetical protein n=1 Tax=Xanthobacter autotrophicus TaxID=280 RepID=UPI00372A6483
MVKPFTSKQQTAAIRADIAQPALPLTGAQSAALAWLDRHTGDGLFDLNGVFVAAGERAPVTRATWNALRDAGCVEFYKPNNMVRGRGRMRITPRGTAIVMMERGQ